MIKRERERNSLMEKHLTDMNEIEKPKFIADLEEVSLKYTFPILRVSL